VQLSDTPGAVRTPPPTLGQHTVEILTKDLGLSEAEVQSLRAEHAI
jgi:crotonobetainyl-CoA:carnitine CoA-transferase CaiB-like acyl-CoA transferase